MRRFLLCMSMLLASCTGPHDPQQEGSPGTGSIVRAELTTCGDTCAPDGCAPGCYPAYVSATACVSGTSYACMAIGEGGFVQCGTTCPEGYVPAGMPSDTENCGPDGQLIACERAGLLRAVTLSPTRVTLGDTVTITVELFQQAASDITVFLITDSAIISFPRDPESHEVSIITILQGSSQASLTVMTDPNATLPDETAVTITATESESGIALVAPPLTVAPKPRVVTLTRTPASTDNTVIGGGTVSLTATLDRAPIGNGALVAMASGAPTVAVVPTNLTIPASTTSRSFTVVTTEVTTATDVTITASLNGSEATYTLRVLPGETSGPSAILDDPGCRTSTLAANDDGSTGAIPLPFSINYFGTTYTNAYVNNNGNLTFRQPQSTFTPYAITAGSVPIIAPFFADVDTQGPGSGLVQYGPATFGGRPAFCVNWINVGYFPGRTDKLNTFQLLLVDRSDMGAGNFDIVMNYDQVAWETGSASGGINGLGGISATVGYSSGTGQNSTFFEMPGSRVNGAFLDSNAATGLIHNSRNSTQPGRYRFEVRTAVAMLGTGRISGTIRSGNLPLAGAPVQACRLTAGGQPISPCPFLTFTNTLGQYNATGLPDGSYVVTAFPPATSFAQPASSGPRNLPPGGSLTVDLDLPAPQGLPPGTSLSPSRLGSNGIPIVNWRDPLDLVTQGCAGATASYEVTIDGIPISSGPMAESPAGVYRAQLAPFYPNHGTARIVMTLRCPDGTVTTQEFSIYIDPSGFVRSVNGAVITGATVTLYRADSPAGPFVQVPDGSAIMSPSNRRNPDLTDANGHFGWDVIAGYYVVRAERAGCHGPDGAPFTTTDVLPVPPPVFDLDLRLDCPTADDRTPPTSSAQVSPAATAGWHRGTVDVRLTAEDPLAGVEYLRYTLYGAQTGSTTVLRTPADLQLSAEGVTTLTYYARDRAGNTEPLQALQILIDNTPPVTGASTSASGAGGAIIVSLRATDRGSGIREIQYRLEGAQTGEATVTGSSAQVQLTHPGTTTITYFARDVAGNVEAPRTLTVRVDDTPPTTQASVSPAADPSGWHQGPVTITLSATDDNSGVKDISYRLQGAETGEHTITGTTATIPISAQGTTTLTFFARDNAGNTEPSQSLTIRIDSTAPVLTCQASPNLLVPPNHKLVPVQVAVHGEDATSGIDEALQLVAVRSSEPDQLTGLSSLLTRLRGGDDALDTPNDIQGWDLGTADVDGLLRAERAGSGPGRTYTLTYQVSDRAGNTTRCETQVLVPHDRR